MFATPLGTPALAKKCSVVLKRNATCLYRKKLVWSKIKVKMDGRGLFNVKISQKNDTLLFNALIFFVLD